MTRRIVLSAGLLGLMLTAGSAAQAQFTAYSNTTTFSGFGYANGGATSGNAITTLVADDIQLAPGFGGVTISTFGFSVGNFDTVAFTARARVRFYDTTGASGGPGNYITGYSFNPISFTAATSTVYTANADTTFIVPANGRFWAAITFDNASGSTATVANLNNLGQGFYGPPTIGTSADNFFQSTAAGSFVSNAPAGTQGNHGVTTVGNFGWLFQTLTAPTASAAPEPDAAALLLSGSALPLLGAAVRRRRRSIA